MEIKIYKRYLVIGVILLLLGIIIVPGISGYFEKTNFIQNENRLNDIKNTNILTTITTSSKWKQEAKLLASDGESDNAFGYSVFLDGDTALIGAYLSNDHMGSAYVYKGYGSTWIEQVILTASDGEFLDNLGFSVSLDGDYALLGCYRDEDFKGSAYVFKRDGFNWIQQDKLMASDAEEMDLFGQSVSIDGDYALIGALMDDEYIGSAYVFKRDGSTWIEEDKLIASDGQSGDYFGGSVSLDGEYALIGAPEDNNIRGSVYVFKRDGSSWIEEFKITSPDGGSNNNFGQSVSLDGEYALIGAYKNDNGRGAAYVFKREGSIWEEEAKLTDLYGEIKDFFGASVSLDGEYALIGAFGDESDTGSACVFKRDGETWYQEDKFFASDGEPDDVFGLSVSLSGKQALIGAYGDNDHRGSAYIFRRLFSDLTCGGRINWIEVNPGETKNNSFVIENIGEEGSSLDWEITDWPEWGNWTFLPISGEGLAPEDGGFTVNVSVVAPEIEGKEFFGNITITNKDNSSDLCKIQIYLKTPRFKTSIHVLDIFWFIKEFPRTFLKLIRLLRR
jgi:hypothetical protein